MNSAYVGILLNESTYRSVPRGASRQEKVRFYTEAARQYGLTPCFFRVKDWKPGQSLVKAYVPHNGRFVLRTIPAPAVIHNRSICLGSKEEKKLDSWVRSGKLLFNRRNRYGKLKVHNLLMENPELCHHLPTTFPATPFTIRSMMRLYDSLIIKPNASSIGRGIMKLEKCGSRWKLSYPVSATAHNCRWKSMFLRQGRLPALLLRRLRRAKYIVQQRLPLATYRGRPFDLRVSVQRNHSGEWQVTGMVAKVGAKGAFVTNIARGGSAYALKPILLQEYPQLNSDEVLQAIEAFSLQVARQLSSRLPRLADLGLDIAITTNGFPMFIECNGKDQRYSFQKAGMSEQWRLTYANPMGYARYLLEQLLQQAQAAAGTEDGMPGQPDFSAEAIDAECETLSGH